MATVLEIQESDARKLLKEGNFANASKVKVTKLATVLKDEIENETIDDSDLSTKSKKTFNRITEALADDRILKIISMNGEAGGEDDEEEAPKKRTKKVPAKKAAAKKKAKDEDDEDDDEEEAPKKKGKKPAAKKRSGGGGGPSTKDKIFEKWVKDPIQTKKKIAKLAEQFDSVQENTIKSWISAWGRNTNLPRAARDRGKEVKAALKKLKG